MKQYVDIKTGWHAEEMCSCTWKFPAVKRTPIKITNTIIVLEKYTEIILRIKQLPEQYCFVQFRVI
jgi:hypothetical protein